MIFLSQAVKGCGSSGKRRAPVANSRAQACNCSRRRGVLYFQAGISTGRVQSRLIPTRSLFALSAINAEAGSQGMQEEVRGTVPWEDEADGCRRSSDFSPRNISQ